jgi:hypothetical protein
MKETVGMRLQVSYCTVVHVRSSNGRGALFLVITTKTRHEPIAQPQWYTVTQQSLDTRANILNIEQQVTFYQPIFY